MSVRCYLVRHAQTTWNGENRLQGHSDQPLNAFGRQQAQRVAAYFAELAAQGRELDMLYTSPLQRSHQTAQAIAAETGLRIHVEPALAEISLGAWEGLTPEEIDARFGGGYQQWKAASSQVRIPDGEPTEQFHRRVHEAFARIAQAHRERGERDIVLVTHGGVIASLLARWLNADYDRFLRRLALENAVVSAVDSKQQPPHVLWVNATHHLTPRAGQPKQPFVLP